MVIKVMGPGCALCKELHENVKNVVGKAKDVSVEYITDMNLIIGAGIMSTPALVIDNMLFAAGRVPSEIEIKQYIDSVKNKDISFTGCSCGGSC